MLQSLMDTAVLTAPTTTSYVTDIVANVIDVVAAGTEITMVPHLRVGGITIVKTLFITVNTARRVPVLWRALDLCAAAEERSVRVRIGNENIPAALKVIDVDLDTSRQRIDISLLSSLTTRYPALARSLHVIKIAWNNCDESAEIGPFAALCSNLRELSFRHSALTSVNGLAGQCEYVRKVELSGCKRLQTLHGLEHHLYLEEVDVSSTGITSLEPLRTCPVLTRVDVRGCKELTVDVNLPDIANVLCDY